jgi:hypothetical protein
MNKRMKSRGPVQRNDDNETDTRPACCSKGGRHWILCWFPRYGFVCHSHTQPNCQRLTKIHVCVYYLFFLVHVKSLLLCFFFLFFRRVVYERQRLASVFWGVVSYYMGQKPVIAFSEFLVYDI